MAICEFTTETAKPGKFAEARTAVLACAAYLNENVEGVRAEVWSNIDGQRNLIHWVVRCDSLAEWERAAAQFRADEGGRRVRAQLGFHHPGAGGIDPTGAYDRSLHRPRRCVRSAGSLRTMATDDPLACGLEMVPDRHNTCSRICCLPQCILCSAAQTRGDTGCCWSSLSVRSRSALSSRHAACWV